MGPSPNPSPSPNPKQVNVGSVLHNMRQRYELQEIYTSIGPQVHLLMVVGGSDVPLGAST